MTAYALAVAPAATGPRPNVSPKNVGSMETTASSEPNVTAYARHRIATEWNG